MENNHPEGLTSGNTIFSVDNYWYLNHAENLVKHGEFNIDVTKPELAVRRTPVYPLFYTLFYWLFGKAPGLALIKYVQLVFYSISVVLIYKIAKIFNLSSFSSVISSFLYGSHLPIMIYTYYTLPEAILPFLVVLSLYFLVRAIKQEKNLYLFLTGVFTALTVLDKPSSIFFIIFILFMLFMHFKKKAIKQLILIGFGGVLILSPWVIRNYSLRNEVIVLEKFYGDPITRGRSLIAMRRFVSCWVHPEKINTTEFAFKLDVKNRHYVDSFLTAFPQEVYSITSEEDLKQLFYDLQDCQKTMRENKEGEFLVCDSELENRFDELKKTYSSKFPANYYFTTPLKNIKDIVFQSGTYPVPIINYNGNNLILKLLKYFNFINWLYMILSVVLLTFMAKKDKLIKGFILSFDVLLLTVLAFFLYYLRIFEIRYFIFLIPFLSISGGILFEKISKKIFSKG